MRVNVFTVSIVIILVFILGYLSGSSIKEGFTTDMPSVPLCATCRNTFPCKKQSCNANGSASRPTCPPCRETDLSKYVLKSTIPSPTVCPDMSLYMLKTECPPSADLSKYVLKSSVPKPQPFIIDNSSCKKECGSCPPCPRPRCPDVKCPPALACPVPAPCPRPVCPAPATKVKCVAEEPTNMQAVRPFLAPLSFGGFGN